MLGNRVYDRFMSKFVELFLKSFFLAHSPIEYELFLNWFIWSLDLTLTVTTTPSQSGSGSNVCEEVLHTLQIY